MNQKNNSYWFFIIIRLITDIILIPFVIIFAYGVKFKIGWVLRNIFSINFGKIYHHAQIEPYFHSLTLIMILWIIAFYFSGLYSGTKKSIMPEIDEIIKIVKGVSIAIIEITALSFFYKSIPESRFVIFYSWVFGILIFSGSRYLIVQLQIWFLRKGLGSDKAIIIGSNLIGQDVVERILFFPTLGLNYFGTLADKMPEKLHFHLRKKFKLLGKPEEFKKIIQENKIKVVFITTQAIDVNTFKELIEYCSLNKIELNIISKSADFLTSHINITNFDGIPFLNYSGNFKKFNFNLFIKSTFDFVVSLCLLIIFSPIFVLVGLYIKLASPRGPIIFSQSRVGKNLKPFQMHKFRTMIPDAEKTSGPVMVTKNDTRYIRGGNFLRKTSLDELPQLFNVLKGEMSLVGPRPERPFFVEKFSKTVPYYTYRHTFRGGITGWAQINGRAALTLSPEHKLKYDLYYIKNWTFILDIKILLKTVLIVFTGEEAY
ncbi:sugar transferase [Candidatus Margulisiibacteriota bacterium]